MNSKQICYIPDGGVIDFQVDKLTYEMAFEYASYPHIITYPGYEGGTEKFLVKASIVQFASNCTIL